MHLFAIGLVKINIIRKASLKQSGRNNFSVKYKPFGLLCLLNSNVQSPFSIRSLFIVFVCDWWKGCAACSLWTANSKTCQHTKDWCGCQFTALSEWFTHCLVFHHYFSWNVFKESRIMQHKSKNKSRMGLHLFLSSWLDLLWPNMQSNIWLIDVLAYRM